MAGLANGKLTLAGSSYKGGNMRDSLDLLRFYARSGQLAKRFRKILARNLYVPIPVDPTRSIIVAGSGRSGTTWVSEIINFDNRYRFIFEPIRPDVLPLLKNLSHKQYLRPEDNDRKYLDPIDKILHGRIRNAYLDKHNMRLFARQALIKMIRGHLLLCWLHQHYPGTPIVFLLRHPCAVASSKLRIGWDSEELESFLDQEDLVTDYLSPYVDKIRGARSELERHVFIWCIENYVVLKQFPANGMLIVFYENLCENPEAELNRLFSFLGRDIDEKVLRLVQMQSATAINYQPPSAQKDIGRWMQHLDSDQVESCVRVLGLFGLDSLYDSNPRPHEEGLSRFGFVSSRGSMPDGCRGN